ncbi:GDSL-type esterase/lipase family protein [Marinomonas mediterranea]|jgi:Lysophospholipase L1 and related esterases|uniref:Cyclic nucleotide-binding protein n=1 Tax=Marinomonas mediterranea (strain ATCC 700492 / JCM 21426 / NBRC 103028 / MMB-1) TaxID=717774 RepID=F2K2A6_MARM1|nr:GDSL-type esterase/lipase family protein [Marinomonas mediterranea]ADZ92286.1 cyclic nucleotide-binding protein [Marinomonas mediterranea MMB-1]WCN18337.1 cyclic nucleotide-binding protein [Marinomonas mediterranea MMB-1]
MDTNEIVPGLPFTQDAPETIIDALKQCGTLKELSAGESLAKQFEIGQEIYFLLDGEIAITIPLREQQKSYHVGLISEQYSPIGWSAFRHPSRYATSFHATKATTLISWPILELVKLIESDLEFGNAFLRFVYTESLPVLTNIQNQTRPFFANESLAFEETRPLRDPESQQHTLKEATTLLSNSAFFEGFTQAELHSFAKKSSIILAHQGDIISQQDEYADGIYLLAKGKAIISYQTDRGEIITTRSISRTGTVLAWCTSDLNLKNRTSIVSSRDSSILFISKQDLISILNDSPKTSVKYWLRLIWLIGTHLLAARMRYLSQIANDEVLAVNNVIEQNSAVLPVSSALYKVGKLLSSVVTTDEAFGILYECLHFGQKIERTISGMCLDILKDQQRENAFYRQLMSIYDHIHELPLEMHAHDVRRKASELFKLAFQQTPYVIKGLENLPRSPNTIFIYNHLMGAESTQLPNGFRFSLDAQFINTMVIDKQYGKTGERVVRRSKDHEYWRDDFYERFGNIFVTSWDDLKKGTQSHNDFIELGKETLRNGTPLLISPEGKSFPTTESPGELLPYVFELADALKGEEEPWIVPIAVANFDRRVDHNIYTVVIKPAFRISEVVDVEDSNSLNTFLAEYKQTYRGYVEEAESLSQEIKAQPVLSYQQGYRSNVRRVNQIDVEFESDVRELEFRVNNRGHGNNAVAFYGSSTMRLWDNFSGAFQPHDAINLGFGGASIKACVYYFERIVIPHSPRSIVLYVGDNDIGNNKSTNKVVSHYVALLEKIDQYLPGIPVTILSIKSSPTREKLRANIEKTNKQLEMLAKSRPNTRYLDLFSKLLDKNGDIDESYFENDRLHLNAKAYKVWTKELLTLQNFIFESRN